MTFAIVGERDGFFRRRMGTAEPFADCRAVAVRSVLVDIIAEMQDGVEIVAARNLVVYVEIAERIVRARHDREARLGESASGHGARPAGGGIDLARPEAGIEAVIIGLARREAVDDGLDRVIARATGFCSPFRADVGEVRVGCDLPGDDGLIDV